MGYLAKFMRETSPTNAVRSFEEVERDAGNVERIQDQCNIKTGHAGTNNTELVLSLDQTTLLGVLGPNIRAWWKIVGSPRR